MKQLLLLLGILGTLPAHTQGKNSNAKGVYLEHISWTTARDHLTPDAVIVIPLGAAAKEHGPHLPLSADYLQAAGTAKLLAAERKVVITPAVNYGHYPAFLRYAGSTSIDFTTATDMILNIVHSLSGYGPKRFYVINTGVSTTSSLVHAAKLLADEGILLHYSQYERPNFAKVGEAIRTEPFGRHAHELETSNILYLHPELVDMSKAVNDTSAKNGQGILSPVIAENTAYSPTGIIGFAALATKEKGKRFMEGYTREVIREIDSLTKSALPKVKERTEAYTKYVGEYTGDGKKNLRVDLKDNQLWLKESNAAFFGPFPLYPHAEDYFSTQYFSVLFTKNEAGEVTRAWFRPRGGESFWMSKLK